MWMMLQQDQPEDYVIATGEQHSVREFADAAFSHLCLDYRKYVKVDPQFFRPTEVETLVGDSTRAKRDLGWACRTNFQTLVEEMVEGDLRLLENCPSR